MEIDIKNENDTIRFAQFLAKHIKKGDVVLLNGELGVGKTFFTKHLALSLGIKDEITSPTFTILKEYYSDINLFHIDAYRLEDSNEDLSYFNELYKEGITIIEWPEFIVDYLPNSYIEIYFKRTGDTSRLLEVNIINKESLIEVICNYE